MRARLAEQHFNKERFAFLFAAASFAASLFIFLVSSPVKLSPGEPITLQREPSAESTMAFGEQFPEDYYVVDKFPGILDARTGQAVNRARPSPFVVEQEPTLQTHRRHPDKDKDIGIHTGCFGYESTERKKQNAPEPKRDVKRDLSFVGVVIREDGQRAGLLRASGAASVRRVKIGDVLAEWNCTVTRIEEQSISLRESKQNEVVLKNTRFAAR